MRFIRKKDIEPKILTEYKNQRRQANQVINYDDFREKSALNDILRLEQKNICCYCQQRITHYQGHNEGGSHNEHFVPQNGALGRPDLDIEYHNIYACCNYSEGKEPSMQHCGHHKGDFLISDFIRRENCRDFFKYNVIGEILPNGIYGTLDEFHANLKLLPQWQIDALNTIDILNLNCPTLKEFRKRSVNEILKLSQNLSRNQAQVMIQRIHNASDSCPPLVEMTIYYLNKIS